MTAAKLKLCMMLAGACLLATTTVQAEKARMLERKVTHKSAFYTGNNEASLRYISLAEWLAQRGNDELPKDIYDRGFIYDDPTIVQPLYDIANRLLAGWPGTVPSVPIFVRADTASSVYGAEVLIGNELLIFYGTLVNVGSDDELAGLIAHELAHVLLAHNTKANYINIALQKFEDYEELKNLHATVQAGDLEKNSQDQYELNFDKEALSSDLKKAREQRERASEFYYAYHNSVLGRGAESKADLLAVDLLVNAGYSPLGLRHSLNRLGSSYRVEALVSDVLKQSSQTLIATTQLALAEQVQHLETTGDVKKASAIPFKKIFRTSVDAMKGVVKRFAWDRFKSSHPVPEGRLQKLATYLDENYSLPQRAKAVKTDELASYKRSGMLVVHNFREVQSARTALLQGDLTVAERHGIASLSGAYDNDPYKRFTMQRIRFSQKNLPGAVTNIERIGSFLSVPNTALTEMVDILVANERVDVAVTAITQKEQFGVTIPNFYPAKISIALNREQQEEAVKIAETCVMDKSLDDQIKFRCLEFGLVDPSAAAPGGGFLNSFKSASSGGKDEVSGEKK